MKACLDTNVFITIKNKEEHSEFCEKILNAIENQKIEGAISTIVIAEILVGFYQNNEIDEADRFLNNLILNFEIIPVDATITLKAAQVQTKFGIKLPDAIIAASTIHSKSDIFITGDQVLHQNKLDFEIFNPKNFVMKYLK